MNITATIAGIIGMTIASSVSVRIAVQETTPLGILVNECRSEEKEG